MTQGKKAMTHFSPAFKQKALARLIAGEKQAAIAKDLKMSSRTLWNWYSAYTAGKLGADGNTIGPKRKLKYKQGVRRIPGEASTDKPEATPAKKRSHKKLKKVVAKPPKVLDVQINRSAATAKVQIERLEKELAYVKADRDILVKALASLTR